MTDEFAKLILWPGDVRNTEPLYPGEEWRFESSPLREAVTDLSLLAGDETYAGLTEFEKNTLRELSKFIEGTYCKLSQAEMDYFGVTRSEGFCSPAAAKQLWQDWNKVSPLKLKQAYLAYAGGIQSAYEDFILYLSQWLTLLEEAATEGYGVLSECC